jgi:hypothetical protein
VKLCCDVPRAPSLQRSRGRLWTVLELRHVGDNSRASALRSRSHLYFLPVESLGTREQEESWSDDQEQEDIDGTGEVEHCVGEKQSPRRYVVVTEY